jgi:hypothetical protein
MKTVLSVYSIVVGVAMIAMWIVLWGMDQIPEIMTRPWEIAMHLTAEFTTAALLIISGFGLLAGYRWAARINVFASGMLVYTLIQSPGYYLQHDATIFVLVSAVCFLLTVVLSPAFRPQPQKL